MFRPSAPLRGAWSMRRTPFSLTSARALATPSSMQKAKLQLHLAALQEGGLHFLILHSFHCVTLQAEHVLEERQALFNALDGNAQVLNVRNFHDVLKFKLKILLQSY